MAESSLSTRSPEILPILKIDSDCEWESVAVNRDQEAEKRRNWREWMAVSTTESGVVGIQMADKGSIGKNRPTIGHSSSPCHDRQNRPQDEVNPHLPVEIELPNVFQRKTSLFSLFRTADHRVPREPFGFCQILGGSNLPSSTYSPTQPLTSPVRSRIEIRFGIVIRPRAMSPNAQTNSSE